MKIFAQNLLGSALLITSLITSTTTSANSESNLYFQLGATYSGLTDSDAADDIKSGPGAQGSIRYFNIKNNAANGYGVGLTVSGHAHDDLTLSTQMLEAHYVLQKEDNIISYYLGYGNVTTELSSFSADSDAWEIGVQSTSIKTENRSIGFFMDLKYVKPSDWDKGLVILGLGVSF